MASAQCTMKWNSPNVDVITPAVHIHLEKEGFGCIFGLPGLSNATEGSKVAHPRTQPQCAGDGNDPKASQAPSLRRLTGLGA